eukprot:325439_1
MFIFNTINNAWINNSAITNSLPYKNIEYGSCVTSNSSHIFIFGGAFAYNHFTNIIQIYNFNDNIWHSYSSHNSLNKLVDSACIYSDISIFNASIFIFGGTLSSGHKSDKIFQYIIDNNQWIQSNTTLSLPRSSIYIVSFNQESEQVILISGNCMFPCYVSNITEIYDIRRDEIYVINSIDLGKRYAMTFVKPNNESVIYMMGGETYINSTDEHTTDSCEVGFIKYRNYNNNKKLTVFQVVLIISVGIATLCALFICGVCKCTNEGKTVYEGTIEFSSLIQK